MTMATFRRTRSTHHGRDSECGGHRGEEGEDSKLHIGVFRLVKFDRNELNSGVWVIIEFDYSLRLNYVFDVRSMVWW